MKKDNLVRGNLAYKDGKTEFIQDSRGKFWLNPATGKIHGGRSWITRKMHSWLWEYKMFASGLPLMAMVVTFLVPMVLEFLRPDDNLESLWIVFGYINIGLLALYGLSALITEPKDDCDC